MHGPDNDDGNRYERVILSSLPACPPHLSLHESMTQRTQALNSCVIMQCRLLLHHRHLDSCCGDVMAMPPWPPFSWRSFVWHRHRHRRRRRRHLQHSHRRRMTRTMRNHLDERHPRRQPRLDDVEGQRVRVNYTFFNVRPWRPRCVVSAMTARRLPQTTNVAPRTAMTMAVANATMADDRRRPLD